MIADHHPKRQSAKNDPDERATPQDWFSRWNELWRFTVDAAATKRNAKCDRYWTKKDNGLLQPWENDHVWCNPPYSDITPWIEKALRFEAPLAVLLVPAWTDRRWFQSLLNGAWTVNGAFDGNSVVLHFLPGRLRFGKPGTKQPDGPAPFPCMLLEFRKGGDT